ncbi:MAG: tRNA (adenosine(37)-N6)-threonylcarbamoyltransferase complex dimerization subunit type 1 TsaB [Clostridia bacterium]|nr:tRNA (adenosine(37)-N6)-threonylcarbamoyltransferase complex dimerization subunit type 1 TsaB [Clostridia bacterium]
MKILTLESSSLSASVCVTDDTRLLAQSFQNCGMTHSATLLPMIDHVMTASQLKIDDIDAVACVTGPGSFTGVRIGVATAKGIADGKNLPCISVSSMAGNAWNIGPLTDRLICPVMDARRSQLYNALFLYSNGKLQRLTPDRLIQIDDLKKELISSEKSVVLVGDGAQMCYNNFIISSDLDIITAPPGLIYPCAHGAAMEAHQMAQKGQLVSAAQLMPSYLRQPQAVRERLAREAGQTVQSTKKE